MNFYLKILFVAVFFNLIQISGWAFQSEKTYQVLTETSENGIYKYKVIEIDSNLLNDQNRISQRIIFEKVSSVQNEKNILIEALKQLSENNNRTENSLSRQSLDHLSRPPKAGLWEPIKDSWSLEDEKDYSLWFTTNGGKDFNKGSNLFADCADVGLLIRWAYAHDKKLPIANSLGGSGKLFGHFSGSAAWDHLPTDPDWKKDERFKAALRYLFDNSYTHTVVNDLYPTEINTQYVHPGSIYMIIREKSGHTQTLFNFDQANAGIRTLWGNEPSSDDLFESWMIWEPAVKNLFGSWRWPYLNKGVWKLTSPEKMPGFSLEQFKKREELNDEEIFEIWFLSKLGMVDFDVAKVTRQIQILSEGLRYRLQITAMGATICGFQHCDLNGADADNYGTPSRDGRLKQSQIDLLNTIEKLGGMQSESVQKAIEAASISDVFIAGYNLSLRDFIFSTERLNSMRSEANLTFRERWGLAESTDSKTVFSFLNQELQFSIIQRRYLFDLAIYYCFRQACNPDDSYIK